MVTQDRSFEVGTVSGDVTARQSTGQLRVTSELSAVTRAEDASLGETGQTEIDEITIRPESIAQAESAINSAITTIAGGVSLNIPQQVIANAIRNQIDQLNPQNSIRSVLNDIGGQIDDNTAEDVNVPLLGSNTHEFNFTNLPTVTIPIPPANQSGFNETEIFEMMDDNIGDSAPPGFNVEYTAPFGLGGGFFGGTNSTSVSFPISSELFIETQVVDIDELIGCSDLSSYNNLLSRAETITNTAEGAIDTAESIQQEAESILAGTPISLDDGANNIEDQTLREFGSNGESIEEVRGQIQDLQGRLDNIFEGGGRSRFTSARTAVTSLSDLENQIQNIQSQAEDIPIPGCANNITNRLIDESRLEILSTLDDQLSGLLNNLPAEGVPQIPCADIEATQEIRSSLSEFENLVGAGDRSVSIPEPIGVQTQTSLQLPGGADIQDANISDISNLDRQSLQQLTKDDLRQKVRQFENSIDEISGGTVGGQGVFGSRGQTLPEVNIASGANVPERCIDQLDQRVRDISDAIDVLETADQVQGRIPACVDEFSTLDSQLGDIEETLGLNVTAGDREFQITEDRLISEIQVNQSRLGSLRQDLSVAQSLLNDSVPRDSPCFAEFSRRISRIQSRFSRIGQSQRGCGSQYPDIREELNTIEEELPSGNTVELGTLNQLRESVNQISEQIDDNVPTGTDCRSEFIEEVEALDLEVGGLSIEGRRMGDVPCAEKFPELNQTAADLFERASELRSNNLSRLREKAREPERVLPNITLEDLKDSTLEDVRVIEQAQDEFVDQVNERVTVSAFDGDTPAANECKQFFFEANGDVSNALRIVRDGLDSLETISGGGGTDLGCGDISETLKTDADNYVEDAREFLDRSIQQRTESRKNTLTDNGEQLIQRIDSEVSSENPCRSQIKSRVRTRATEVRDTRTRPALGCEDVPQRILNRVETYVTDVDMFMNRAVRQRNRDQRDALVQEGQEVLDVVEQNISPDNECRQQERSRVRSSLRAVRNARVQARTAQSCEERFSEIGDRLSDFENQVLALNAPVDADQIQAIGTEGNNIINLIQNNIPQDDPCRREMTRQVERLIERTQSLTVQVRVEQAETGQESRQEALQNVLDNLDSIGSS